MQGKHRLMDGFYNAGIDCWLSLSIEDHATKMQDKIIKYGKLQAGYTSGVVYAML